MSWTVSVKLDEDKDDVGVATATWDAGGPNEYVYASRLRATGADLAAFVSQANTEKDAELARRVSQSNYATTISNALNA